MQPAQRNGLWTIEKWALAIIPLLAIAFGALVEIRSAYLSTRKTDLDVYLRAAWAVRTGNNLYAITDDHGWHYNYPPLFAILMTPFADAPPSAEQPNLAVPYKVSVAVWYLFSVVCLAWAIHILAEAFERSSSRDFRPGSRAWWGLRFWPFAICLPAIGSALSRGQVNTLLLLLLAGFTAETARNYRGRAGFWLAGAMSLKVIPAFLLLIPLVRRDGRGLVACGAGLIIGLGIIPAVAMGPQRAYEASRTFLVQTLQPGIGSQESGNKVVAKELTNINATDNQSIQAIVHNIRHWFEQPRPPLADGLTKAIHVGTVLAMVVLTFLAVRRVDNPSLGVQMLAGNLILVMILASPVCHHHYFCLGIPATLVLIGLEMERNGGARIGWGMIALIGGELATGILPRMPGLERLRDAGVAMQGMLLLWGASLVVMGRMPRGVEILAEKEAMELSKAA